MEAKVGKENFFCSRLSLETKEEMFGTVPRVDIWFLLEYKQAWSKKAFASSKIPEAIKKRFSEYLDSFPNSRLQLIKREMNAEDTIKLYVGVSRELEPKLFELSLSNYEEILSLDISAIIAGSSFLRKEPLFLICTHGTHDQCCGKFGMPIYMETSKRENGFLTWQCTHLGGHRFAANFLCLPYGIYYGRVRENDVGDIITECKNQNICLGIYRGRSCYSADAQAAEYFLRTNTGIRKILGLRLKEINKPDKDNSLVKFISELDEKVHLVHMQKNPSAIQNYTSCNDDEQSTIAQYRFIEYKTV